MSSLSRHIGVLGQIAAFYLLHFLFFGRHFVDAIARNAWPLRIGRDGTLHVAAASATWAFELDRMSADWRAPP